MRIAVVGSFLLPNVYIGKRWPEFACCCALTVDDPFLKAIVGQIAGLSWDVGAAGCG